MSEFDKFILIIAALLANWRLAYLLVHEAAPFGVLVRFRYMIGASPAHCAEQQASVITNVFCCIRCMSLWTPLIIGVLLSEEIYIIIYGLAISAVTIIIDDVV